MHEVRAEPLDHRTRSAGLREWGRLPEDITPTAALGGGGGGEAVVGGLAGGDGPGPDQRLYCDGS